MNRDQLYSERRDYRMGSLQENEIPSSPFPLFKNWLDEALRLKLPDATAMSLVTAVPGDFPQSRIVLLKAYDERGFVFFTNYDSNKGRAITANNQVMLHFFWPRLERQIRISGTADKTSRAETETYFRSRPRESQIAAIVSQQSREVGSREELDHAFRKLAEKSPNAPLQCPDNWGGYRVFPFSFEFWQGGPNRLHDRILYQRKDANWHIKRLSP